MFEEPRIKQEINEVKKWETAMLAIGNSLIIAYIFYQILT